MIALKYIGYSIFHTFSRFSINWIGCFFSLSLFTLHTNWTVLHLSHEMNSIIHLKGKLNWFTISNSTYCLMFYCSVLWCDCICYYYYYYCCYSKVLFFIFNFWSPGISFISSSPILFESRTGLVDICIGGCKCYIMYVCVSSINYQCLRYFLALMLCCTNHLPCCLQCYCRFCNIQWTMSTSGWI